jgi:hypothetical protein
LFGRYAQTYGHREAKTTSPLTASLQVKFLPYDKHYSVEYEQPSEESEERGYSTAKMSFDCLQAAGPQFQLVKQILAGNGELK